MKAAGTSAPAIAMAWFALVSTVTWAGAAPAAEVEVDVLDDGARVVVVTLPKATEVSFRLVVAAGGSSDPDAKKGLAHVVEHFLFQGSHRRQGRTLLLQARAAGAQYNGITTADGTTYQLDLPAEAAELVLPSFVEMVENPAFELAPFEAEMGVVETEALAFSSLGLEWAADQILFPSENQGVALIGSSSSRRAIRLEDIQRFYREHYHAANLTYVVVGPWSKGRALEILEQGRCLPADPAGRQPPRPAEPSLPAEAKARAPQALALYGYALAKTEAEVCAQLRHVVQARAEDRLLIEQPAASAVTSWCTELRGNLFLLTAGYGPPPEASTLLTALEGVYASLGKTPISKAEQKQATRQAQGERRRWLAEPHLLADELAARARSRLPKARARLRRTLTSPKVDRARLQKAAAKNFLPSRAVSVQLSPYLR